MQFIRPHRLKPLLRSTQHSLIFKNKQFVRCITDPVLPPRNYNNSYKKPEFLTPRTVLKIESDTLPWYAVPQGQKPKQELEFSKDADNIANLMDETFIPRKAELLAWLKDYNVYFARGDYENARKIAEDGGRAIDKAVNSSYKILQPWYKKLERYHLLIADCVAHCYNRQGRFEEAALTLYRSEPHLKMLPPKIQTKLRSRWYHGLAHSLSNIPSPTPFTNALARKYADKILQVNPMSKIGILVKLQILLRSNPKDPHYVWKEHEEKVFAMFEVLESVMTKFDAQLWRAYAYRELGSAGKQLGFDTKGYYLKAGELYLQLSKERPDDFDLKRNAEDPLEGRELCDKFLKQVGKNECIVLWQDRATFFFDSALDLDDAIYAASEGLKLDPGNKYLMWKKGEALLMKELDGAFDEGIKVLKECVKSPESPSEVLVVIKAYNAIALAYKDSPEAYFYWNELLKLGKPYEALLQKGHYLLKNTVLYEEAFECLNEAYQIKATVWGGIGLLLAGVRLAKWDYCMEVLESLFLLIDLKETTSVNRVLPPEFKDELLGYVQKYNNREDLYATVEKPRLEISDISENTTLEDRAFEITSCLVRGWYLDVEKHVEQAIKHGIENAYFYMCRAYAHQMRHYSHCLVDIYTVVEKAPHVAASYYTAGNFLREFKIYGEAADMFKKGTEKFPADGTMWGYLGTTLQLLENFEAAEAALKRALTLEPHNFLVMHSYAMVLTELGRKEEAAHWLRKAKRFNFTGTDERGVPRRDPRITNRKRWEEWEKYEKSLDE